MWQIGSQSFAYLTLASATGAVRVSTPTAATRANAVLSVVFVFVRDGVSKGTRVGVFATAATGPRRVRRTHGTRTDRGAVTANISEMETCGCLGKGK